MKKAIFRFDQFITRRLQRLPVGFEVAMKAITIFGSPFLTLPLAGAGAAIGVLQQNEDIIALFMAIVVAVVVNNVIKVTVRRRRPETSYAQAMQLKTFSFPSGHAFSSLLVYGVLVVLAIENAGVLLALLLVLLGLGLIAVIGVSRVYLGAHYASDVAGSWVLGAIALVLLWPLIGAL